jgi:hypothetical protein
MSGYGGYKNWATWNFSLWHMDTLHEQAIELSNELDDLSDVLDMVCNYWDDVKDNHSEMAGVGWLGDVLDAFTDEVDWNEIAEHVWEAVVAWKEADLKYLRKKL